MIQNEEENTFNVPTLNFSLNQINSISPSNEPSLFQSPAPKQSKRRPGSITNLRDIKKSTVSELLQVFKPKQYNQLDEFDIKKKLVVNAIDAIYQNKKIPERLLLTPQKYQLALRKSPSRPQAWRSIISTPQTPPQKQKSHYSPTTSKTKVSQRTQSFIRSSSQTKLNYSRNQQKFSMEEVYKLRKKNGCTR